MKDRRWTTLREEERHHVIEMAWADEIPFEGIERLYGLPEKEVICLMRRFLKPSSFRMWRKRVSGRKTKHTKRLERNEAVHLKRSKSRW